MNRIFKITRSTGLIQYGTGARVAAVLRACERNAEVAAVTKIEAAPLGKWSDVTSEFIVEEK